MPTLQMLTSAILQLGCNQDEDTTIRTDRQFRVLSISNSQGLFTLQGLRVGKYRLEINGKQIRSIFLPLRPVKQR
jgi:hypothetical protein